MPAPTIRPAATLVLTRDGAAGIEVCMVRRSARAAFARGAFVFPGGAVDPGDVSVVEAGARWLAGESAAAGDDGRGEPFPSGAHRLAAIRETLEECGVLVGLSPAEAIAAAQLPQLAWEARRGGAEALGAACERAGAQLQLSDLALLAHWVTPPGRSRRFDTRFFVAAAPESCPPLTPDGSETVAAEWVTPQALLQRHADGEAPMLPPTLATLAWLAEQPTADAAVQAARAQPEIVRIAPPGREPAPDGAEGAAA